MFKADNWMQESMYIYGGGVALVLLIIGVIAFVGPSSDVTESCAFGEGLECVDFKIGPTGAVIAVKNNLGKDLNLETVEMGDCRNDFSDFIIDSGKTVLIPVDGCDMGGEVFADDVSITFTEKGKVSQNSVTGNVVGRVQNTNIYDAFNTPKADPALENGSANLSLENQTALMNQSMDQPMNQSPGESEKSEEVLLGNESTSINESVQDGTNQGAEQDIGNITEEDYNISADVESTEINMTNTTEQES